MGIRRVLHPLANTVKPNKTTASFTLHLEDALRSGRCMTIYLGAKKRSAGLLKQI